MKLGALVKNLLFPPKCIACGVLLDAYHDERPEEILCASCRGEWESAKLELCGTCFLPRVDCRCAPSYMERAGFAGAVSLFSYTEDGRRVGNRVVLYLKRYRDARAVRFIARQLSHSLTALLKEESLEGANLVFAYAPRRAEKVRAEGLDQAKCLASHLAACYGEREQVLFARQKGGSAQKLLSYRERRQNAKEAFRLSAELPSLRGKVVVIVDDVITSGATMAACAALLRGKGVRATIGVSIAKTLAVKK